MWLFKLVLILSLIAVSLSALIYVQQTRMLFPTELAGAVRSDLPASAISLEIEIPDGNRLHGVHIPAKAAPNDEGVALLGFGGNAWNAGSMAAYLHEIFPDNGVISFYYRGYRPSTGRPSAAALLADAPLIHDEIVKIVGGKPIVAIGFSIGTGVAAELAARRRIAGAILVSPFESLESLARVHFPWAPIKLVLRHRMPIAESLRNLSVPIAIIAAEDDEIVPAYLTDALRQAIHNPVFDIAVAGAGHNDLYQRPEFLDAMKVALARIRAATVDGRDRSSTRKIGG